MEKRKSNKIKPNSTINDTTKSKSRAIVEPTKIYHSGRGGKREGAGRKPRKNKLIISLDQQQYLLKLEKCLLTLPKKPPEDWDAKPLARAAAYAEIITKRLSFFNDLTAKAPDSLTEEL